MSVLNPEIVLEENVQGFEAVVASLQLAFASLDWNEKSFGRAFEQPDDNGEKRTPKVYTREGEYYDVLPNDNLKSFSFIMARSPERYTLDAGIERDVSAVFWLNLNEVRPGVDKASISAYENEVLNLINQCPYVHSVTNVYDERIEDIFFGYIEGERLGNNKYLMFPFAGFRMDFVVSYPVVCDPAASSYVWQTQGRAPLEYITLRANGRTAKVYLVEVEGQLTLEIVEQ